MWGITKILSVTFFSVLVPFSFVRAVTLFPENANVSVNPGETQTIQLIVANDGFAEKTYIITIVQGALDPVSGDIMFTEDESLRDWIASDIDSATIAPMNQVTLEISIRPNATVVPGNYIAGVQVQERVPADGTVAVSSGFISLLFLTVGDSLTQNVELLDFSSSIHFFAHLPVQFFATMKNSGEAMSQPGGAVTIRDLFGNIVTAVPFNSGANRLLPGQTRTLVSQWGSDADVKGFFAHVVQEYKGLCIGIFKAEAVIVPFENVAITPDAIWIIVFPWHLVLCMSSVLIAVLFLAFVFQRKRL